MTILMKTNYVWLVCIVSLLQSCGESKSLQQFVGAVALTSDMVLFEGLPHQGFESKLLATELSSKDTVQIHGFPFYTLPLSITDDDKERVVQILSDGSSYEKYDGFVKKCGGFHPDYAAQWSIAEDVYTALIYFGCGEMKIFGPGINELYDLNTGLLSLLKKYRVNRPAFGS